MPVTAVIFDFDETLADTLPGRADTLRALLSAHVGRDVPLPEVHVLIRRGSYIEAQIEDFLGGDQVAAAALGIAYREEYYRVDREALAAYRGIRELLVALPGSGVASAIVTSRYRTGPDGKTHWGVLRELRQMELTDAFQVVVGYEDSERHKPDPDPFLVALERLQLSPDEVIALGDSPFDMIGARAAGVIAAAALWGAYDRDALLAEKPDIVLEQPADLLQYLG